MRKYIFLGVGLLALSAPLVAGAVAFNSPIASKTLNDLLNTIINISLKIVLPLATIVILVAAFFIIRAQGRSEEFAKGKKFLTFGLIGLAIVIVGAGSGALIKNILEIKDNITGLDYLPPSAYGLNITTVKDAKDLDATLKEFIKNLQQQITEAEKTGDKDNLKELNKELANAKELENSVRLWGDELTKQTTEQTNQYINTIENYMTDSQAGKKILEQYGVKDENGFYKMVGGKYNPDTGVFIDSSTGKTYTDTALYGNGSVTCSYCNK